MKSTDGVVTIQSVDQLGPAFTANDNSINLTLTSNVPEICKEEICILGVDEAGRGPVLGPMVYGISYCPKSKENKLKEFGCADSKTLSEKDRDDILEKIINNNDSIGWIVEAISPNSICNSMLQRQKYSLNQIAQDSTVYLINKAIEQGVRIAEVYVDTVGVPEKYQAKLSEIFPEFKITVAKKADSTYPIVSAASICAKVSRDKALSVWNFREPLNIPPEQFGSGYPNDPVTKKFLAENIDPIFGFPQLVRFSWSTADKILQDNSVDVEWFEQEDDESVKNNTTITQFFKPNSPGSKNSQRPRHAYFTERKLVSTTSISSFN